MTWPWLPVAIDEMMARTGQAPAKELEAVLSGIRLRMEAKIVCRPARYPDERGRELEGRLSRFLS